MRSSRNLDEARALLDWRSADAGPLLAGRTGAGLTGSTRPLLAGRARLLSIAAGGPGRLRVGIVGDIHKFPLVVARPAIQLPDRRRLALAPNAANQLSGRALPTNACLGIVPPHRAERLVAKGGSRTRVSVRTLRTAALPAHRRLTADAGSLSTQPRRSVDHPRPHVARPRQTGALGARAHGADRLQLEVAAGDRILVLPA